MITIKVTFEGGDYLTTNFNGTLEEAQDYYLGHSFNLGVIIDSMHQVIKVEVI